MEDQTVVCRQEKVVQRPLCAVSAREIGAAGRTDVPGVYGERPAEIAV